jgi:hypothetical protein
MRVCALVVVCPVLPPQAATYDQPRDALDASLCLPFALPDRVYLCHLH